MTINPDHHDLVRTRAYLVWVEEGRPEGRDVEHWYRALELVSSEGVQPVSSAGATGSRRKRAPAEAKPSSKAAKKTSTTK